MRIIEVSRNVWHICKWNGEKWEQFTHLDFFDHQEALEFFRRNYPDYELFVGGVVTTAPN